MLLLTGVLSAAPPKANAGVIAANMLSNYKLIERVLKSKNKHILKQTIEKS